MGSVFREATGERERLPALAGGGGEGEGEEEEELGSLYKTNHPLTLTPSPPRKLGLD